MKRRRIQLRNFFRNQDSWRCRISPDGIRISFLKPWNHRQNIFVQIGSNGKAKRVTSETLRNIPDYFWKGNRDLIYQLDSHLYRVDLMKNKVIEITPSKKASVAVLDDLEGISSDEILIGLMRAKQNVADVYRLNVFSSNRRMTRVARHPDVRKFGTVQRWITDNAGQVCAAVSIKGLNDYLLTRPNQKSHFKPARIMDFRQSINWTSSLFYTRDNKGIYSISQIEKTRDKAALVIISAKTGKETRCVYQNRHADLESFVFSKKRKVVTYAFFHNDKPRVKTLDRSTTTIFKALTKRLRRHIVQIVGQDKAEKKFILLARNDRMMGRYFLFDAPSRRLRLLAKVAPWLEEKHLAPVRPIKFRSFDGLTIHGYLTLPRGCKPKKLPLVVNIHGGPEQRDYWFCAAPEGAEVQFLANRGYAVLQLNFRGSVGYGRSFWEKGFKQRGRKMQRDVTEGVQWLIRRKIADRNRIAIYGKSYGGYAALAGITFTPNLYKAGIDYSGVSNWFTWLESHSGPLLARFCIKVGDPKKDQTRLQAVAPALHTNQINAPIFIAHGGRDPVVSKAESDQMVAALIATRPERNLDVEYMVKVDEGHTFQNEENKIAFYKAMETFLAKHLR
jgi:dipeptidyl aminopeptidase/acylaminoacyl peptidase